MALHHRQLALLQHRLIEGGLGLGGIGAIRLAHVFGQGFEREPDPIGGSPRLVSCADIVGEEQRLRPEDLVALRIGSLLFVLGGVRLDEGFLFGDVGLVSQLSCCWRIRSAGASRKSARRRPAASRRWRPRCRRAGTTGGALAGVRTRRQTPPPAPSGRRRRACGSRAKGRGRAGATASPRAVRPRPNAWPPRSAAGGTGCRRGCRRAIAAARRQ